MSEIAPFLKDPTSQYIIEKQYVQRDDKDQPLENALGVFERVGKGVAKAEASKSRPKYAKLFTDLHTSGDFCGGGRILAGAGTAHGNMLNCFTQGAHLHQPDSFDGVMELALKLAKVTKVGGGNGVNLDELEVASEEGIAGVRMPCYRGPWYVAMSSHHKDVASFVKGEVTDITKPGAPRVHKPLRRLTKVVYGRVEGELAELCTQHGVMVLPERTSLTTHKLLNVPDSIVGIMQEAASTARSVMEGESVMIDISSLRPENSYIVGSGGTSSGPYSFVQEIFDHFIHWAAIGGVLAGPVATLRYVYAPVLRVVRQGGTRRGAGMATIEITNPNALDFLTAKDTNRERLEGEIGTFNISLLVTDDFVGLIERDEVVPVRYHRVPGKYDTLPVDENGYVKARWLWRQVAEHAWSTGEPGIIFVDRINEMSALKYMALLDRLYWICKTNPCGEVPLVTGEPCDLGAMNYANFIVGPLLRGKFDFPRFKERVKLATRFLDNVLDVNVFALDDNREASQLMRRLGLGGMGLADALIKMGLSYASDEGRAMAYEICKAEAEAALEASIELGEERGVFPLMLQYPEQFKHIRPRRNVAFLTMAPTGTTAMAFAVSSGIEPIYALLLDRKVGEEYIQVLHPLFKEVLGSIAPTPAYELLAGGWDWDKLFSDLKAHEGSCQELDLPAEIKAVFVTAHDMSPEDHVKMQGMVQRAFDAHSEFGANSLSKTINLPESATIEDIENAYTLAFSERCKGITVYRNNSRQFQVLNAGKKADDEVKPEAQAEHNEATCPCCQKASFERFTGEQVGATRAKLPRQRPSRLPGLNERIDTAEGKLYVQVNYDNEGIRELVANLGKGGGVLASLVEGIGRLASVALKHRTPVEDIIHSLRGIRGGNPYGFGPKQTLSIPDAIGKVLADMPEQIFVTGSDDTPDDIEADLQRQLPEILEAAGMASQGLNLAEARTGKAYNAEEAKAELKRRRELDPVRDMGLSPECSDCGGRIVFEQGCSKCSRCGNSKCG